MDLRLELQIVAKNEGLFEHYIMCLRSIVDNLATIGEEASKIYFFLYAFEGLDLSYNYENVDV